MVGCKVKDSVLTPSRPHCFNPLWLLLREGLTQKQILASPPERSITADVKHGDEQVLREKVDVYMPDTSWLFSCYGTDS
jgi:hypothetical protein